MQITSAGLLQAHAFLESTLLKKEKKRTKNFRLNALYERCNSMLYLCMDDLYYFETKIVKKETWDVRGGV